MPRPSRSWMVAVLLGWLLALTVGVWWARWDGGWAPDLHFGSSEATVGVNQGHPYLDGDLVSTGSFPVTITGVRAAVPGLGRPHVVLRRNDGRPLNFPVRLQGGERVRLSIEWDRLECKSVRAGEAYFVAVSYVNLVGIPGTVELMLGWWLRPGSNVGIVNGPPQGVGWPLAVSWFACGRPAGKAPIPVFP
ncbi:MAG TPA: hypothetical protein VKU92_04885 [Acidimicrobiales bacterium]|nr:hypothetical protein [Acidimicrobiales bacterium]